MLYVPIPITQPITVHNSAILTVSMAHLFFNFLYKKRTYLNLFRKFSLLLFFFYIIY
nr:MAG TPA_asm: hypothetical protein [Caudoviricetes sp.]